MSGMLLRREGKGDKMKFNINNNVRVKLTDKGREIHRKKYDNLWNGYHSLPYIPVEEDENGWSTWQLWQLMSNFGDSMYNGCDLPFETEIEIMEGQ